MIKHVTLQHIFQKFKEVHNFLKERGFNTNSQIFFNTQTDKKEDLILMLTQKGTVYAVCPSGLTYNFIQVSDPCLMNELFNIAEDAVAGRHKYLESTLALAKARYYMAASRS